MIKFYLIIFIIFFIASCNHHYYKTANNKNKSTYTFNGKINGMDTGWLYLVHIDTSDNNLAAIDSAKVMNSYFQFHGQITNPEPCKIMFKNEEYLWPYSPYFILDSGITNGELFKDSMANSIITGTKLQEQFVAFNKKIFGIALSYEKKALLYRKESKNTDSLDDRFYRDKYDLILKEIKTHPRSFVSAYLVKRNLMEEMSIADLENLYNSLDNSNTNSYSTYLFNLLNAKKQTAIGSLAPNFKIIDSKNRTLINENFKGKYLLIDFWASWCSPCREENPYLVKAYNKFANTGFEIISISLDLNKRDWEDAIKKDSLTWIQACDLKGSRSEIVENFGFLTIPANFLINKKGQIINRNLTGEMLQHVLQAELEKY